MVDIHLAVMPQYFDSTDPGVLYPPFGIACLAAYLKKNGIKPTCTDFRLVSDGAFLLSARGFYNFKGDTYVSDVADLSLILCMARNYKQKRHLLHGFGDEILDYIKYANTDYYQLKKDIKDTYFSIESQIRALSRHEIVGFTTIASNFFFTIMASLMLRQANPNIKIIYGGPHTTLSMHSAKLALRLEAADIIVCSEGEETLLKVIKAYKGCKPPAEDGTITYDRQKDKFIIKPLKQFPDLNSLPEPDFSIFQMDMYDPLHMPIYASRGCVFKCSFCTHMKIERYSLRYPARVVDSMERLHGKYNTLRFHFTDSALNINQKWLEQFADELIMRKCNFQWWGYLKPWNDEGLILKLKNSGLYETNLGVESLSDNVLKMMGKSNTNSKYILRSIDSLCSMGIRVSVGIIVGFPGETKSDFFYTWRRLFELKERHGDNFIIKPHLFRLMPSSECYDKYRDYGITVKKWPNKIAKILPEASNVVKDIPMTFTLEKPKNREKLDRYILLNNIKGLAKRGITELEKTFLKQSIKYAYAKETSRVKVDLEGMQIFGTQSKDESVFVLSTSLKKIILTEKEMFIFQNLNGINFVSEIIAKLSALYKEDKKNSYKSLLQLLYYLVDNNISFDIK